MFIRNLVFLAAVAVVAASEGAFAQTHPVTPQKSVPCTELKNAPDNKGRHTTTCPVSPAPKGAAPRGYRDRGQPTEGKGGPGRLHGKPIHGLVESQAKPHSIYNRADQNQEPAQDPNNNGPGGHNYHR